MFTGKSNKIAVIRKKALNHQVDVHLQGEELLLKLKQDGSTKNMRKAHKILSECGSTSEAPIKLIRGVTPNGQEFGRIDGISKCGSPVCIHCGSEILTATYVSLKSRMEEFRRSCEIDNSITYAAAFTCQHRFGDSLEGLKRLLRGAEAYFRTTPLAKQLILGWVCATECTTGASRGNGAHIHTQFMYTLKGTDIAAHAKLWEEAEGHFRDYFDRHSEEVLGTHRKILWQREWVKSQGAGLTGFYGLNPASDWNLLKEVTHGNIKNGGIWGALSPNEYADFMLAVGGNIFSVGGCWLPEQQPETLLRGEIVASIKSDVWNRLSPESKRMIRTVVMSPEYWTWREVEAYAEFTYRTLPADKIDTLIKDRYQFDSKCLPGRGNTPPDPQVIAW